MMTWVILTCVVLLAAGAVCSSGREYTDRQPVAVFDAKRYMGTWYEIARYDHSFERGLSDVKAHYTLLSNEQIEVVNSGRAALTGKMKQARGKAHTTSVTGRLRVSFFWIFYSDYNVLGLDADYRWALVGSSTPGYLWILSRTPQLPEATLHHILQLARSRGYDTDKLLFVEQSDRAAY